MNHKDAQSNTVSTFQL